MFSATLLYTPPRWSEEATGSPANREPPPPPEPTRCVPVTASDQPSIDGDFSRAGTELRRRPEGDRALGAKAMKESLIATLPRSPKLDLVDPRAPSTFFGLRGVLRRDVTGVRLRLLTPTDHL